MLSEQGKTMVAVFVTIATGWVAFALPYPIFSHVFLEPEHGVVSAQMPQTQRTLLLGTAIALYPLGQILGSPVLGRWSDRHGRKRVLQFSLWSAVFGSGILASGVALGSIPVLLLGRFLSGLAEGSLSIAQSIASDVSTPATKARNFAAIGIAVDLGFIVGPLIGGVLADDDLVPWFSVELPFWVATGMFVLNALALPFLLREPTSTSAPTVVAPRALRSTLRDARLAPTFVVSFLTFWTITVFFDFFALYFVQVFRTSPAALGVYAALISGPLIASGLCVNRVVQRWGARNTAIASALLMSVGLAWFVVPDELWGLVLPIIVICIGINFAQTTTSLLISDLAPGDEQGQALGVYRSITVLAAGLSAFVGGALSGLSPAYPFYTGIVSAIAAGVVLLVGPGSTAVTHQLRV
jgi:DHA1 family tetracycline resistance protein-like MFS transporter